VRLLMLLLSKCCVMSAEECKPQGTDGRLQGEKQTESCSKSLYTQRKCTAHDMYALDTDLMQELDTDCWDC